MIRSDSHDQWTLVTIDRPEKANALDADHCRGLTEALTSAVEDGDRALVITGVGNVFSAGADFGGVQGDDFGDAHSNLLRTLAELPIPVIAAINGHAIGAGMQVAIGADLRVVDEDATFGIPTARLGLAVDPWTIERLASLIGVGAARRLLMTCDRYTPDDSAVAGLIDRRGDLDVACELADDLASMAPLTLAYVKTTLNEIASGRHRSDAALAAHRRIWASDDSREGLRARREGRQPMFTGR